MAIIEITLSHLRNEEHVQLHTEVEEVTESSNPITLNIAVVFAAYKLKIIDERTALDVMIKSGISDALIKSDAVRDNTFRGFSDAINSASKHFNTTIKQAALNLMYPLHYFGNIAEKPFDQESAAINSLVIDLETKYAADVAAVPGLSGWITELKANNDAFNSLKKDRYTEESTKTSLKMKTVRKEVDAAYRKLTNRINALIEINGEAEYTDYVNELNVRIGAFKEKIAQRNGLNAKDEVVVETPVA